MESRVPGESGVVMAEEHALVVDSPDGPTLSADELERKRLKKREKVRSAWISFVGRIVAQIMGAVATISLGLMLVQRYRHRLRVRLRCRPPGTPRRSRCGQAGHARRGVAGRAAVAGRLRGRRGIIRQGNDRRAHHDLVRLDSVRVVSRTSSAIYGKAGGRCRRSPARSVSISLSRDGHEGEGRVRIAAGLMTPGATNICWQILRPAVTAGADRPGRSRGSHRQSHQDRARLDASRLSRRGVRPSNRPTPAILGAR